MPPYEETTALVTDGPYRLTRNPGYLSFTLIYLSVALLADAPWVLVPLPAVLALIDRGVIVREERYLAMIREIGYAARRQAVNGLHVHVGVESAAACHERLESVLPWLPVVLAVSANSPYVDGVDSGMQSTR